MEELADFGRAACALVRTSLGAFGRERLFAEVTEPAAVAAGPRVQEPIAQRLSGGSAALLGGAPRCPRCHKARRTSA